MSSPQLEYAFTIVAEVGPPLPIEARAGEQLDIIPITGGTVTGRITAMVEPGGADWCRLRSDGAYEVEARYWIRTDDGAVIDIVNVGRIAPEIAGSDADELFITTPQFRTIAPQYQWLTQRAFVGQAVSTDAHTTIAVYEVVG